MKLLQSDDIYNIGNVTTSHAKLPVGVYMLMVSQTGFFLKRKEEFQLPVKIYGDHSHVDRYITAWENTTKNLGIILSGLKGSGKTITAQLLCKRLNAPVIMLSEGFAGPAFVDFVTNPIFEGSVVFIDEFEKLYPASYIDEDGDTQPSNPTDLLTIMSGAHPTHLLFLLTCNKFNVNEYLINRLERVKYRKHYDSLGEDVINAVVDDLLVNKDHKESILQFFQRINMCTFDLLVNLIKEMNLFNEDAIECGKHLNLKAEDISFEVTEIFKDQEYPCHVLHGNAFQENIVISRKDVKYLGKTKADYEDWNVQIDASNAIIERQVGGSFTIQIPKSKSKFVFKPRSEYSSVF